MSGRGTAKAATLMGVLLDTEWADGSKRRRDDGAKKQGTREARLSDRYRVVLAVCHMSWLDFDNILDFIWRRLANSIVATASYSVAIFGCIKKVRYCRPDI